MPIKKYVGPRPKVEVKSTNRQYRRATEAAQRKADKKARQQ